MKERKCQICDTVLSPVYCKSGKSKGKIYYRKLCNGCLKLRRSEVMKKTAEERDYDKTRKYFKRMCAFCGKEFSVKGLNNSHSLKTCSKKCLSGLKGKICTESNSSYKNFFLNLHKAHVSNFEKPQRKESLKLGPLHWKSLKSIIRSPDGVLYDVCNLKDFVRTNQHLFSDKDTEWVPASKRSKVADLDYRPSQAVGCLRCRASSGLAAVVSGNRNSWKGWTLVKRLDGSDGTENRKTEN